MSEKSRPEAVEVRSGRWFTSRRTAVAAVVPLACAGLLGGVIAPGAAAGADRPTAVAKTRASDQAGATRALFASITARTPGCTVAVSRNGTVQFAEAYGAATLTSSGAPRRAMTPGTVVDIGSTSKQFTATAVLLLARQGRIDMNARVSTYLPSLPAWSRKVTVTQMMHHTSGIADYIELLNRSGVTDAEPATDADALRVLKTSTLTFAPGAKWEYSNSNYFLLGQVVFAVTGRDLGNYLRREVFDPLKLDAQMEPNTTDPRKATSYARKNGRWVVADSRWEQLGDGGVQTTPTQLVRWASQYWNPTIGGPGLLRDRTRGAVATGEQSLGRYGAGIFTRSDPALGRVLSHTGGWAGFVTTFDVLPERRLAVAATCTTQELFTRPGGLPVDLGDRLLAIWKR
jgi:CubicO group peptidase (beta-lactamase class C family)